MPRKYLGSSLNLVNPVPMFWIGGRGAGEGGGMRAGWGVGCRPVELWFLWWGWGDRAWTGERMHVAS